MTIPIVNLKATGQNIKELMRISNLSVKDVQLAFGFEAPQAIYKWIHGRSVPTIDNLVILAAILDVRIDDIVVTDDVAS